MSADRVCNNLMTCSLEPATRAVAVNMHSSTEGPTGEADNVACGSSGDDDRSFEVRGSWGGSIDSTAGAAVARMMGRLKLHGELHTRTSTDSGHCRSMPSSNTASCEFAEGATLNSCLCHSSFAACSDLNGMAEEDTADEGCSRTGSEREKPSVIVASAELGQCGQEYHKEWPSAAPCLLSAQECGLCGTEAISIQPQHLVVQEHATGSLASSSMVTGSAVSTDKPGGLQHQRSTTARTHGGALQCTTGHAAAEGAAQMSDGPASHVFCVLHGGALERELSGKRDCKEQPESSGTCRGPDSTQSLHALADHTSSQERLSALPASPVCTGVDASA